MPEFKRERRYVVVKISDLNASDLTNEEIRAFNHVCDQVALTRVRKFKKPLECVVVESDWPEYEPTWAAIEARMCGFPCPFCGGKVDTEGWLDNSGKRGPECESCGATAPSMDVWIKRI